jgi:hypothetical protein
MIKHAEKYTNHKKCVSVCLYPFYLKQFLPYDKYSLSLIVFVTIHQGGERNFLHRKVAGVVGIATGYGLEGPGIESRWGQDFQHQSRPALGTTQSPVQWVPGLSQG